MLPAAYRAALAAVASMALLLLGPLNPPRVISSSPRRGDIYPAVRPDVYLLMNICRRRREIEEKRNRGRRRARPAKPVGNCESFFIPGMRGMSLSPRCARNMDYNVYVVYSRSGEISYNGWPRKYISVRTLFIGFLTFEGGQIFPFARMFLGCKTG